MAAVAGWGEVCGIMSLSQRSACRAGLDVAAVVRGEGALGREKGVRRQGGVTPVGG